MESKRFVYDATNNHKYVRLKNSNNHLINGYIVNYLTKCLYAKIGTTFPDVYVTLSTKKGKQLKHRKQN